MTSILALASAGLLLLPALTRALGRRLPAARWKGVCVTALFVGWAGLETALFLHAATMGLRSVGGTTLGRLCERMMMNLNVGGPVSGWLAGGLFLVSVAWAGTAWWRARATVAGLKIEPGFGARMQSSRSEVVVLPTVLPVAYSTNGSLRQVVLSEGIVAALEPPQLDMLIRHEEAHLRHRDQRVLMGLAALRASLRWLPGVSASVDATRLAVERTADETAAGASQGNRDALAVALLRTAESCLGEPAAAFNTADGLDERVAAMRGTLRPLPRPAGALFYSVVGLLPVGLTGALFLCAVMADRLAAIACMCFG